MKSLTACLIVAIVLCVGVSYTTRGDDDQGNRGASRGGKIVGTWRVQVTLRNCQTGAEIRTFPALLNFANGGTLTGTSTVLPPSARGGDFGIWKRNGHGSYSAVSEAFLFNGAVWSQRQRITQAITLSADDDTFYSNARTEFFDPVGNLVSNGCATAIATRMSL
jgi:hypothetical protein